MKQTTLSKNLSRTALTLILSAVLTLLGLSAITCYDNKYIAKAVRTQADFTQIPTKGCYSLVDGWELYPDVLLSPEDFSSQVCQPSPSYNAWAGQYPNLHLLGRLAEYKYYNMDAIAARALTLADGLL